MNMMNMGLMARGHGLVLPSTYDRHLVALSVVVASIAAYTALTLAERVTVAHGRLRLLWLLGGATAMGSGIWSMHFTGMLAFTLPIPVSYDVLLVALSLLVAIAASGSALFIVSRRAMGRRAWLVGGLLLGGGIATMHYTGMAAMRMAAMTHWDLLLVGLSVLVAVVVSLVALFLAFHLRAVTMRRATRRRLAAAGVMGVAIAGMHYTGMAGATFTSRAMPLSGDAVVSASALGAGAITLITLLVLGLALGVAFIDRRFAAQEEALAESKQHVRMVVANAPVILFALDATGVITLAQGRGLAALGHAPDAVMGRSFCDVYDDVPELVRQAHRALAGEEHTALSAVRDVVLETRWTPIHDDQGQVAGVIAVATDITERKQAEQALEQSNQELERSNAELAALTARLQEVDQLKTQFFAMVSHELRTPLTLILGPLERLRASGALAPGSRQDLDVMERNARLLLRHVNDLLDVAKLDAERMALQVADADLARLLRLTASHFEALAQERGIAFTVQAPPALLARIDPEKVQRAVFNLLANAFKFTPAGGRIRLVLDATTDSVTVAVGDSGPGVPPALRDAIFESFRQGHGDATRPFGGTGLGLAIVKQFAALHGGAVAVGDAPEGGALFTVTLPLVPVADAGVAPVASAIDYTAALASQELTELRPRDAPSAAVPAEAATEQALALVVEDNAEMSHFIVQTLAAAYRTVTAVDGQDGLEKALTLRPDVILSDMMMPRMSGEHFVRAVRAQPDLDGVPIIILTARSDEELRARLLSEGAQDYLVKPFATAELRARVGNLITMKRTRDVLQQDLAGQRRGLEDLAREVTARRQEAETANRAKDEFLSHAAHELKTPLAALLGHLELAERYVRRALAPQTMDAATVAGTLARVQRFHQRADAQIERLTRLTNDLLDVARIQEGKLELLLDTCDLAALVRAIVEEQRDAGAGGVVCPTLAEGLSVPIVADADRLRQVVANYLSNALKFAPPDRPIEVGLETTDATAHVWVRDEGPGLAPDEREHIWERLYQVAGVGPRRGSRIGLGLGLYICRTIIELHGGQVGVTSTEGQGATFWFRVPLAGPQDAVAAATEVAATTGMAVSGEDEA